MYKFTNGVVVFTEEDKDNMVRAGYVLVQEEKKEEENVKENDSNGIIEEKPRTNNKITSRFRR